MAVLQGSSRWLCHFLADLCRSTTGLISVLFLRASFDKRRSANFILLGNTAGRRDELRN